jgi:hypothetical protein
VRKKERYIKPAEYAAYMIWRAAGERPAVTWLTARIYGVYFAGYRAAARKYQRKIADLRRAQASTRAARRTQR